MATRRTINDLLSSSRAGLERLRPEEASAAVRAGALLIDTRCGELRDSDGVVPGSVHVPALSDVDRQVILLCAHGYSSSLAAATLRELGFLRATDVIGGFEAWKDAGLPVVEAADRPQG
jgi:rhodanese-related sulfurtransferase